MNLEYTSDASERIENLVEDDIANIWSAVDTLAGVEDSEKWKATLESIAREYLLSSRFALMRILSSRQDCQGQIPVEEASLSLEYAADLSPEAHLDWMGFLLDIAGPSPEEDPDLHQRILSRAWHDEESANAVMGHGLPRSVTEDPKKLKKHLTRIEKENKKRYQAAFTREEALQLGHILRFTLTEMQWYLLRVFDVGDGLRLNRSGDLIEAYCFLTGGSCFLAETLKQEYSRRSQGIEKRDDARRARNWTRQLTGGLLEQIEQWKLYPEDRDAHFLNWLTEQAPGLDIPSRTARRIYRDLAVYAYLGQLPQEEDLLDELLDLCDLTQERSETVETLYRDGQVCQPLCNQVANHLYWENKTISDPTVKDNTTLWSVITLRKDRTLSASYGAINSSRTRIQSLLMGTEEVEKGDLLYLLWFTCNLAWGDARQPDANMLYNRIFDLKDAAAALLEAALLPPFYPPHLLEQSMLLSIICAGKTGTDPAAVYGTLLQSAKGTRTRETGSRKHTPEEKLEIVRHYRDASDPAKKMTLKECALLYGISEKTLSQWQKELEDQGLIGSV